MQTNAGRTEGGTIQVHVDDMGQLFNSMDPAAETFIVEWARDLPRDVPMSLQIHADQWGGNERDHQVVRESI